MSKASLAILLFVSFSSPALAASLYSRNLSCKDWTASRDNEICRTLEREMEWMWTGHAILAPSFRVTFETVRKTYCAISVSSQDTAALVEMVVAVERKAGGSVAEAQLLSGTRFLLYLLGPQALGAFPEDKKDWDNRSRQVAKTLREDIAFNSADPAMIWNPVNPSICCFKAAVNRLDSAVVAAVSRGMSEECAGSIDNFPSIG
jgi:hypothetical protein